MVDPGKVVKVHYTLTLNDGSVVDSSEGKAPFEFKLGAGQVIPGFDQAVQQMSVGDKKQVKIPCVDAYGEKKQEMIATIPRDKFPADITLEVGQTFEMSTEQGPVPIRIVRIMDASVQIDGNHPLAGEDLTFDITLTEVV
jgi:peptidylprolyl isomerase